MVKFNRSTKYGDIGDGSIFYLDRHAVECKKNEVLQGFLFRSPKRGKWSYRFKCLEIPNMSEKYYRHSTNQFTAGDDPKKSANYLDRHNVHCYEGHALQYFQLKRGNRRGIDHKINIRYKCVKVNCGEFITREFKRKSGGDFATIYLTNHDIRVKENEVLTGFRLQSKDGDLYYKYTVCELKNGGAFKA